MAASLACMQQNGALAAATCEVRRAPAVADPPCAPCCVSLRLQVSFSIHKPTQLGEDVAVVGSHDSLGAWNLGNALPLTWTDGHHWRGSLEVPANAGRIEFKVGGHSGVSAWARDRVSVCHV